MTIPENVSTIKNYAFINCENLETVYYNAKKCSMQSTSLEWYEDKDDLLKQYHECFPAYAEEVISIYYFVGSIFENCNKFTTLYIGENVEKLNSFAFAYSPALKTVYYNAKNCQTMGTSYKFEGYHDGDLSVSYDVYVPQFLGCKNLTTLEIGENVEYIPDEAFYSSNFKELIFNAKNCTYAGSSSKPIFKDNKSINTIEIGKNVRNIPETLFSELTVTQNINLNNNINFAYYEGCLYSSNLEKLIYWPNKKEIINLHEKTLTINKELLKEPNEIKQFIVDKNNKVFTSIDGILFSKDKTELIYFIKGKNSYTVPESTKIIGEYAFFNTDLENIKFSSYLKSIKAHAFQKSKNLKSIVIPNNVEEIGTATFNQIETLTSVTLGEGIVNIPTYCFSSDTNLKDVKLSDNTKTIGAYAFYNCKSLKEITIPYLVNDIGKEAFNKSGLSIINGYANTYADTYAMKHNIIFFEIEPITYKPYDVNCDGYVDIRDVTEIQKYLACLCDFNDQQKLLADIDNNSEININDVTNLQVILANTFD